MTAESDTQRFGYPLALQRFMSSELLKIASLAQRTLAAIRAGAAGLPQWGDPREVADPSWSTRTGERTEVGFESGIQPHAAAPARAQSKSPVAQSWEILTQIAKTAFQSLEPSLEKVRASLALLTASLNRSARSARKLKRGFELTRVQGGYLCETLHVLSDTLGYKMQLFRDDLERMMAGVRESLRALGRLNAVLRVWNTQLLVTFDRMRLLAFWQRILQIGIVGATLAQRRWNAALRELPLEGLTLKVLGLEFAFLSLSQVIEGITARVDQLAQALKALQLKGSQGDGQSTAFPWADFIDLLKKSVNTVLKKVKGVSKGFDELGAAGEGGEVLGFSARLSRWIQDLLKCLPELLTESLPDILGMMGMEELGALMEGGLALFVPEVGAVIAALVGLGAAVVTLWNQFESFRGGVMGLWSVLRDFGGILQDFVIDRLKGMLSGMSGMGSALMHLFKGAWSAAWDVTKKAVSDLIGFGDVKKAYDRAQGLGHSFRKGYERGVGMGKIAIPFQSKGQPEAHKPALPSPEVLPPLLGVQGGGLGLRRSELRAPGFRAPFVRPDQRPVAPLMGKDLGRDIQALTAGGRSPSPCITLNLEKLQDKIEIHTATLTEGLDEVESRVKDTLLRVLQHVNPTPIA